MLPLKLHQGSTLKVLCLGAHCDDIEIGCGGTLLRLSEEYPDLNVKWIVFTSTPERETEARKSAAHILDSVRDKEIVVRNFRDGYLPYEADGVKKYFEALKAFDPDLIFTHFRHDLHQDHRLICDLTWNTFRDHFILEYEIPKYDGDMGSPNFFVPLARAVAKQKTDTLMKYFPSQSGKHWFDEETFFSLMRIRGLESASKGQYAEAFYLRKAII